MASAHLELKQLGSCQEERRTDDWLGGVKSGCSCVVDVSGGSIICP